MEDGLVGGALGPSHAAPQPPLHGPLPSGYSQLPLLSLPIVSVSFLVTWGGGGGGQWGQVVQPLTLTPALSAQQDSEAVAYAEASYK